MPTPPGRIGDAGEASPPVPAGPEVAHEQPREVVAGRARHDPVTAPMRSEDLYRAPAAAGGRRQTLAYGEDSSPEKSEPDEPETHVRAAIEASTRAEANLGALLSAIEQATSGVSGVREANERLSTELQRVRDLLGAVNERRMVLEGQLTMVALERDRALRELEQLREATAEERAFLVDEQDRFLNSLLEEHEQAVSALKRELDEARQQAREQSSRPPAPLGVDRRAAPTNPYLPAVGAAPGDADALRQSLNESERRIDKLVSERERARNVLRRLQMQRDEAQDNADRLSEELDRVRAEIDALKSAQPLPDGGRLNQDAKRTDPAGPDRPTFPVPASALHAAIEASRALSPSTPPVASAEPEPAPEQPQPLQLRSAPRAAERVSVPPELKAAVLDAEARTGRAKAADAGFEDEVSEDDWTLPGADPLDLEIDLPAMPEKKDPSSPKRPALKQKPNPVEQPLGGYSVGRDDSESDRVEHVSYPSSRPPRR